MANIQATCNCVTEVALTSGMSHADPFNEVELDVVATGPTGEMRLPGFWAGGKTWRFRFAPPAPGKYELQTVCSDASDTGLHGQRYTLDATLYAGDNTLLAHGRLRISENRRHFEHADGTPFLWLGDAWWMALAKRLKWPDGFKTLVADRKAKGFSVIQLVAGLYPDMPPFDPRAVNEAGQPWEADFARVNPAFFDMADLRINHLVESGMVPCIVAAWGYFLPYMGVDKMKKQWRYLVARYSALPVVWCIAGEGAMPFYLSPTQEEDSILLRSGWSEIGHYIRKIDPYHNIATMHSSNYQGSRDQVADTSVLDFDMMQTGHAGFDSIPATTRLMREGLVRRPTMPVVVGETCFEGCQGTNYGDVQRIQYWNCMLNGAAGHTYGAIGTWNMNTREEPYGKSPHGSGWGDTPWDEAMNWPGSRLVGQAKKVLERLRWWLMEPRPEWVGNFNPADPLAPWVAGVPGEFRVYYSYRPLNSGYRFACRGLEPGAKYKATYVDPLTGKEYDAGVASGEDWRPPTPPIIQDWVVVLERQN